MKIHQSPSRDVRANPFGIALSLLKTLHPPQQIFNRISGALRARDVKTLSQVGEFQDREYPDSELWSVLVERQIASLFKKNDAFADEDRCAKAAEINFKAAERNCRITNKRLDWYWGREERLAPDLRAQLWRMQQEIEHLLGDTADFLGAMPKLVRLTSGATEDRSRRRSLPFLKVTRKLRGPRAAVPYIGRLLREYGVDLASCVYECVERNVITLVPKNWKTHRTIAKEPTHSLPFQLALDQWLKGRLKRWGIDLGTQTRNQELARLGSIDGSWATLDLSMASDTVSFNTVAWLLPWPWFELLCSFRSSSYSAPWGTGTYAKFSSMGNGFTFSLETLIFTAACRAVGSRHAAVYGDDIVIESAYAQSLVRLLRFLGFRLNDAKSFMHPQCSFRESCGSDWYRGHLVTPFYMRECPKETDRAGMSHLLNGLIACSNPGPTWDWCASEVRRLGLRLVPWNHDSRSGVWMTPQYCWRNRKLEIDRHVTRTGEKGPNYGFPTFKGYGQTRDSRKTVGIRSLFLWHLRKGYKGARPVPFSSGRSAVFLMQAIDQWENELYGTATVTSELTVRCRYVHKTLRFSPEPMTTPSYLFLLEEVMGSKSR
jgi:hypothetical protein